MNVWKRIVVVLVTLFTIFSYSVLSATAANASAYAKDVYSPELHGTTLEAWAVLGHDCSGTYGCWNYMKIERKRAWGWQFVEGNWRNEDGWNSISANQPTGCFDYRTTVDSYNDVLVSQGQGVDIGPVGTNSDGQEIHRFRTTWSSGSTRYCRN